MKVCYGCEHANENGYCKFTACRKQSFVSNSTNTDKLIKIQDIEVAQYIDSLKQENEKLKQIVKEAKNYIKGLKDGRFIFNNNAKDLLDILSKLE